MAHLNKVLMIGRVVDAVQTVPFQNGGKVAKFRLAVSDSRKNQETAKIYHIQPKRRFVLTLPFVLFV